MTDRIAAAHADHGAGDAHLTVRAAPPRLPRFDAARAWKASGKGPVVGYFPVWAPLEIAHAARCLPVNVAGAMGDVEVERADARMQSFACSISRSSLELLLGGHLSFVDGMIFSNICDVARNLSGIWQRNTPHPMLYLHLPQREGGELALQYTRGEFARAWEWFKRLSGARSGRRALVRSIRAYNRLRRTLRQIDRFRQANPHLLPLGEWDELLEAVVTSPVEESVPRAANALVRVAARVGKPMDRVRVLVAGTFCERPPRRLLGLIEEAGCYVLGDDLLPSARFYSGDVDEQGDPLTALARAFLEKGMTTSVRHARLRPHEMVESARRLHVDGVLFASAKFCEPALYDYVLQKDALEAAKIPYLHIEYEEKLGAVEQLRAQIETFVESVLFFAPDDAPRSKPSPEVRA